MAVNDTNKRITDNIIAMLDKGTVPWRMAWKRRGQSIPLNAWNRPYRGVNVFILAFTAQAMGYRSRYWMTFNQAQKAGGRVRAGEKGTLVVFWTLFEVEDKTSKTGKKRIPILRPFTVFNLDQTHDVKLTKRQAADLAESEADGITHEEFNDDAEAIISTYLAMDGAPSYNEDGSDRAFYSPAQDAITVPARSQYENLNEFYATVNHEFVHSTGHESRLKREGVMGFDHFGSGTYAAEELVAEFGAAFLNAEAGVVNTLENSAAYIASWKRKLQDDPTLLVKAAGKAQKAVDFILGTTFEKEEAEA
jgi:antirestriction protein ArdC